MGTQQKHKGMFLKDERGGHKNCPTGWVGGDIFPVYSRGGGGGGAFLFAYQFGPSPAILNERSLTKEKRERMWIIPVYYSLWHTLH